VPRRAKPKEKVKERVKEAESIAMWYGSGLYKLLNTRQANLIQG
jgi:hypothetical protein